jgi:hypothetical protein
MQQRNIMKIEAQNSCIYNLNEFKCIEFTAAFRPIESQRFQQTPHAHGASGSPGGSCLLSSAATITMRMGQAAVGAAPAGGKVTDSIVITE